MKTEARSNELTRVIINAIKEKQPETVEQLVNIVKEKLQISEKEIIETILKLQSEERISLLKQPIPTPQTLAEYVQTEQALWYWIAIAIATITAVTVFTIPEDLYPWVYIRYVMGTIFVLWLPGFSFIKALFPKHVPLKLSTENLDTIERAALSLGMSLALVPIVGLLLNYTPWGIRLAPIVLSLLTLTIIFSTVALVREHRIIMKTEE